MKPSFTNQEKWTRAVIVANHIFVFRLFSLSDTVRIYTEKEATAYIKITKFPDNLPEYLLSPPTEEMLLKLEPLTEGRKLINTDIF